MPARFDHMIPATREDRDLVRRLADRVGRPAQAVELALDWAIDTAPAPDPSFRPDLQIHVVLGRDYRSQYNPQAIGQMLHLGLKHYWSNYQNGVAARKGVEYWEIDLPVHVVRRIYAKAFRTGMDPETALHDEFRDAIRSLLADLPPDGSTAVTVSVPTTPEIRLLFDSLVNRTAPFQWDMDSMLEHRISDTVRRRP